LPVVEALEQLAIPYHIGGSVASSLYGEFRPTQDVDIVADLQLAHVRSFVKLLKDDYYIVEDAVRDVIRLLCFVFGSASTYTCPISFSLTYALRFVRDSYDHFMNVP